MTRGLWTIGFQIPAVRVRRMYAVDFIETFSASPTSATVAPLRQRRCRCRDKKLQVEHVATVATARRGARPAAGAAAGRSASAALTGGGGEGYPTLRGARAASRAMPKNRKPPRKPAETLRVASFLDPERLPGEPTGSLLVVQGAEIDLGRHVMCDHPITIGRDERADLTLSDGSISRAHCAVERAEGGHYVLIDLGWTNGSALNGERVRDGVRLSPGDKIFLGASVIRFAYSDQLDLQFPSRLEEMVSIDPLTGMSS